MCHQCMMSPIIRSGQRIRCRNHQFAAPGGQYRPSGYRIDARNQRDGASGIPGSSSNRPCENTTGADGSPWVAATSPRSGARSRPACALDSRYRKARPRPGMVRCTSSTQSVPGQVLGRFCGNTSRNGTCRQIHRPRCRSAPRPGSPAPARGFAAIAIRISGAVCPCAEAYKRIAIGRRVSSCWLFAVIVQIGTPACAGYVIPSDGGGSGC